MRAVPIACIVAISCVVAIAQSSTPPPPQSARQALIEMFLGKGAEDFSRHLPNDARKALLHKGETPQTSVALRIANIGREVTGQPGRVETFEVGPDILISDDPVTHEKVEIAVEHDSLFGEEDEIELSVHVYKDGQPQALPVVPSLTFRLKQEEEVWRLTEVVASAHIPLTDPDYLQGLRKEQDRTNEVGVRARITMIAEAETRYAADHKETGYTCSLTALFPPPISGEEQAAYAAGFAGDEANAYHLTLAGCQGTPVSKYQLLAIPMDPDSEMDVFCIDESGTLKSIPQDGKSSCFSSGKVVTGASATNLIFE